MEGFAAFEDFPAVADELPETVPNTQYYVDEEEALGFHIWVAELELLVGQARGSKQGVDPVAAMELLQKLQVTIESSEKSRIREYQRRCEDALEDILLKGTAPPVRRLICACLVRLYSVGDSLPLYSRVASLQTFLGSKEALNRSLALPARLGALQALAALASGHGRSLASVAPESLALGAKHAARQSEPPVRIAAVQLMAAVVGGLGGGDRNSTSVQAEALKAVSRVAKDGANSEARLALAGVVRAVAQAGGAALWAANGRPYEDAAALCVGFLDDTMRAAGDAAGTALGDFVAAAASDAAAEAARALDKKPAKKAALEKLQTEAFTACLVDPFVEAAKADRRRSLRALSQAWLAYLTHVQKKGEENALVDLAVKAIEMLAQLGNAAADRAASASSSGAEADAGQGLGSGEVPAAQAAVLYVLRVGVIEQMGETGQRLLLERLTALAASVLGDCTPVAVVTLEALGLLLEVLGEVAPEVTALLQDPLTWKLTGSCSLLRAQAAATLAALSVAEPASACRLLTQQLEALEEASSQLASLVGPFGAQNPPPEPPQGRSGTGTPRGLGATELEKHKPIMDSVHGRALGTAALLVASTRLALGVPSRLARRAMAAAEGLIRRPGSQRAAGQGVEREAGYVILSALCVCAGPQLLKQPAELLDLWQPALGVDSAAALDVRRFVAAPNPSWETEAAAEMWWRASALQALQAFALGPLAAAARPEAERMQETIAALLAPTLDIISSLPPLQEAARGKAVGPGPAFVAAAAQLQLRLVEAYLALPDAAAFATEHEALSKLCARAFRSATGTGTAQSVAASALQQVLNHQDDVLGPWAPGRDPLEDALAAFTGAPGGPVHHPWEAGLPYSAGYLGAEAAGATILKRSHQPLPQPRSLSAALLEAQLTLLGSLLAVVSQPNQLQILDVLNTASNEGMGGKGRRERPDPVRRHTAVTCVCAAALAGLDTLARKFRGEVGSRDEVAARASGLADSVLSVAADAGDAALQRSAAEMFAFASCIGSTGFAAALVRTLVSAMTETTSAPRRAALALAIGCIIRSKGGIALQSTLNPVADTFLAVAAVCTGPVQLWLLHGLWLTANAAGPAFLPHVKATLAHAVQVLMAEDNAAVAGLQPAVGRLANALVAVLGPELTLGSAAYCRCRAIIREMQATAGAVGRPEDAPAAALETVSYAQMLVLFAPQAVPAAAHLPLLLDTLPSRQPNLRRAAALTLRHLAERDARALLPARMEGALFRALDAETDGEIAGQLRATLRTLLRIGVPSEPSYWLEVCSQVALAAVERTAGLGQSVSGSAGGAGACGFRGGLDEGLMDGGDEEEAEDGGSRTGVGGAPARGPSLPAGDATAAAGGARLGGAPRLRTRLFAAQCILDIPTSVGADARHFDTAKSGGGDWLVGKLQGLIDAGFKMASGAVEALRPLGVQLLQAVLEKFGAAEDPLLPGHLLLEQYQAQFVSALRSALAPGAAPSLAAAGASLAAAFLEAGMATGDTVVLRRLMALLVEPLAAWDSNPEEVYAEWVGVRARVSLLEAHAQCAAFTAARAGNSDVAIINEAQAPHARTLRRQWGALLQDWALLGSCSPEAAAAYTPAFLPEPAAAVLPRMADAIDKAAPASLLALSSLLAAASNASDLDDSKVAAQQLLDICHLTIAKASARLAPPSISVPSSNGGLPHSSAAAEPAQLLLTVLTALQRLVAADSPLLGAVDLENLVVLINSTLQQVLAPLLTCNPKRGHYSLGAAAACFAAAAAILASVGRAAAASAGCSSHLDERLAEAALCAISIAVTASEAPSVLTGNLQIESGLHGAFQAAEGVCRRERHLAAALLSAAIRVLQISHQDAHINTARGFLERVAPVLGEPDRARNGGRIGAEPPLLAATLGSLADVAQECLSQAEVSNGDGSAAVKTSGRISAVVSLLMSMGAELESDQPSGNTSADFGANAPSGLSDAAEHGADARVGSSEAPDDDFDEFEEAEEGTSGAAAADTERAAPEKDAPAQDSTTDAATLRDDAEQVALDQLAHDCDKHAEASESGMGEAAAAQEGSEEASSPGRPAEAGILGVPAVTVPVIGSSGTGTDFAVLGSNGRKASGDWGARERCLKVVEACCSCSSQPPVQAAALRAVRGALQRSQAENGGVPSAGAAAGPNRRAASWALECALRALPAATADVHALMRGGRAAALAPAEVQVVAETLKVLVASLPCTGAKLGATMSVLLMMLVEVASPEGAPNLALRELAVKLVTLVASGSSGAAFQAAVAALSPEAKQRLQAGIKASSAAPATSPAAAKAARVAVTAPPAITLQNFALKS